MSRTLKKLKKDNPNLSQEVEESAKDLDTAKALDVLADSEGGQILIETHVKDVIGTIEWLGAKYKTATHIELITRCADLKSKLDVLRSLTRAKRNKELLQDYIAEAIKQ